MSNFNSFRTTYILSTRKKHQIEYDVGQKNTKSIFYSKQHSLLPFKGEKLFNDGDYTYSIKNYESKRRVFYDTSKIKLYLLRNTTHLET